MRQESWPEDLHDYLANPPAFEWGIADCCLWCADWILMATGIDHGGDFRGAYADEKQAYARLKAEGFADVDQMAAAFLPSTPVALAQRGDIVCAVFDGRKTLGLCAGAHSGFLREVGGVEWVPTLDCMAAWRVA